MNDALLRLAWSGANPASLRDLWETRGSEAALSRGAPPDAKAILASLGVGFLTDLPDHLAGLPDAPLWLFVRGKLPPIPGVAVVGSRRATSYGLGLAEEIGRRIAEAGWPVVSGLAVGVDGAAHRGCLRGGGVGVAVLGSGIDVWYPARHAQLGERLLATGGCVVSEFPPGARPEPWRFPCRNRIISGLSKVVIVVEAAVRSGALITARYALEHGREVFAVPGDLDRETSVGCNLLIRDGAHPVTRLEHLVEDLELAMGPAPRPASESPPFDLAGPTTVEDLADRLGIPIEQLCVELARLEVRGEVSLEAGTVIPRSSSRES